MSRRRAALGTAAITAVFANTRAARSAGRLLDRLGWYALVGLAVAALWVRQWWADQSTVVHVLILTVAVALLALWADRRWNGGRLASGLPGVPATDPLAGEPTGVYTFRAPDDEQLLELCRRLTGDRWRPLELLYIGISNDPERRLEQHLDRKPWLCPGVTWTGYVMGSRPVALEEERRRIRAERPRYNVQHNGVPA